MEEISAWSGMDQANGKAVDARERAATYPLIKVGQILLNVRRTVRRLSGDGLLGFTVYSALFLGLCNSSRTHKLHAVRENDLRSHTIRPILEGRTARAQARLSQIHRGGYAFRHLSCAILLPHSREEAQQPNGCGQDHVRVSLDYLWCGRCHKALEQSHGLEREEL